MLTFWYLYAIISSLIFNVYAWEGHRQNKRGHILPDRSALITISSALVFTKAWGTKRDGGAGQCRGVLAFGRPDGNHRPAPFPR